MQILALLSFNYEILFGGASTVSLCSLRSDLCVKVKHIYFKQERKECQRKGTPPQKRKGTPSHGSHSFQHHWPWLCQVEYFVASLSA